MEQKRRRDIDEEQDAIATILAGITAIVVIVISIAVSIYGG